MIYTARPIERQGIRNSAGWKGGEFEPGPDLLKFFVFPERLLPVICRLKPPQGMRVFPEKSPLELWVRGGTYPLCQISSRLKFRNA